MSDTVLAALISGAISGAVALIVGASGAYVTLRGQKATAQQKAEEARREAEVAQRNEAVAYLKALATTISRMREQLDKEQIPRTLGHYFIGLLDDYVGRLQPYLGDETRHELDKLKRRVQEPAEILDGRLYSGRKPEPEMLSEVLADMERVVGDLEALATRISPTRSLVQP
jgi:hypothetical protein